MARIGAHLSAFEIRLLDTLRTSEAAAALNGLRLTTGRKINSPRDNPSGFVHVTRLENQLAQVQATAANVAAASSIASQSQLAIDQIRSQLESIHALLLADEDQSLTASERAANQAQIDKAITAVRGLAGTKIDGMRRLDGSADFRTDGLDPSRVQELRVHTPGAGQISIAVITAATRATLTYTGAAGQVTDEATFTLTGKRGSTSFSVTQNEDLSDVADRVNQQSHNTGVFAMVNDDDLVFTGVDYGAAAPVQVVVGSGTFNVTGGDGNGLAYGTNADVVVNGRRFTSAQGTVENHPRVHGNRVSYIANGKHFDLVLAPGVVGSLGIITVHDDSTQRFRLHTADSLTTILAIPGLLPEHFRGTSGSLDQLQSGGGLDGLGANTSRALRIVGEALARLTVVEGRVDAFANQAVHASAEFLAGLETKLQESLDSVNAVDETEEKLLLARNQALADNALSSLQVLQSQRARVVDLLEQIAGSW